MGEIARKRRPVLVGDVIMSGHGDVVPIDPDSPPPARLRLEDVTVEIRIPAPYVAEKFVDAAFTTYRPDPAAPSQQAALGATKEFCRRVHAGDAPLLAL